MAMGLETPRQLNDLTVKPQKLEALKKAAGPWQSYPMVGPMVGGTKVQWLATLQPCDSATIPHKVRWAKDLQWAGCLLWTESFTCPTSILPCLSVPSGCSEWERVRNATWPGWHCVPYRVSKLHLSSTLTCCFPLRVGKRRCLLPSWKEQQDSCPFVPLRLFGALVLHNRKENKGLSDTSRVSGLSL